MKLFLGVDGGQSSTVALIADETGRVLGAGRGGPCNHVAAAEAKAKFAQTMEDCLGGACAQAGLNPKAVDFEAAALGFSGGIGNKEAYSREMIRSRAFVVTNDAEVALAGATGGEAGVIVIAGTGSIAFGKDAAGRTGRAGGWGYLFGDEGGAFDLVRQALRAALAMEEGWGCDTKLRDELLSRTGAASANALMHEWYDGWDRANIARLAPGVNAIAEQGDTRAREILTNAGSQLAGLVKHVFCMLFAAGDDAVVSYVGGVFQSGLLLESLKRSVAEDTGCVPTAPLYPPAAGALLLALRMAGCGSPLTNIPAIKS